MLQAFCIFFSFLQNRNFTTYPQVPAPRFAHPGLLVSMLWAYFIFVEFSPKAEFNNIPAVTGEVVGEEGMENCHRDAAAAGSESFGINKTIACLDIKI